MLLLREWYMHPSGQIPAYEFAFGDVNPPVHAWAAWRVYKISAPRGQRDRAFLERVFQKLLINFTWWVNRKDVAGKQVFSGGFLGLDNIGVFDRSKPLPNGGSSRTGRWLRLDGVLLHRPCLRLRSNFRIEDPGLRRHRVEVLRALRRHRGCDEYARRHTGSGTKKTASITTSCSTGGMTTPLKVRSMVGLIPLFAVEVLEEEAIERLPGFRKRHALVSAQSRRSVSPDFHDGDRAKTAGTRIACSRSRPKRAWARAAAAARRERVSFAVRHPLAFRGVSRSTRTCCVLDGQERTRQYDPGESHTGTFRRQFELARADLVSRSIIC